MPSLYLMRARAHAWVYRACVRARLVFYSVFLTESCKSVLCLFVLLSTDPFKGGRVAKEKGESPFQDSYESMVDAAVLRVQEAERELRLARNAERQARARRAEELRKEQARLGGA